MNKKILTLGSAVALMIFLRCVSENAENVVYIVAGINIIAIVFVICTLAEKIVEGVICKIEESKVPEQIVLRETQKAKSRVWSWVSIPSIILIALYVKFWCSGMGNDIISILALGLSVLDDEIVKQVVEKHKI